VFGVGVPLAIAIAFTALGLVLMGAWRFAGRDAGRSFFGRPALEAVPGDIAERGGRVPPVGAAEEEV
jgi:hypothetical protein